MEKERMLRTKEVFKNGDEDSFFEEMAKRWQHTLHC